MSAPDPLPVLYSFRRCPYAMRARLALLASGQRCELREVVLRDKPAELLAASPKATVPVLVLADGRDGSDGRDGRVIEQSLEIMLWALRRSDPGHWLAPGNGTLAEMLVLIEACDTGFKRDLDRYKYPARHAAAESLAPAEAQAARESGSAFLLQLETRLAGHAFLFGETAALADAAIAPFVRQFAGVDAEWFALQPWPRLREWLAAWQATADFAIVMQRYPAWKPGDLSVTFPPDRC